MTATELHLRECLARLSEARTSVVMCLARFKQINPEKYDNEEAERMIALRQHVEREQLHVQHLLDEELKRPPPPLVVPEAIAQFLSDIERAKRQRH